MKITVGLVALLFSAQAFAGKCDVKVPSIEIKVMAGSKQVLVPVVASITVLKGKRFTLASIDDGFTIPITEDRKLEVEHDVVKNVIRIKEKTIELGRQGGIGACHKIKSVKFLLNGKSSDYELPYLSGAEHQRLIQHGEVRKYIDISDDSELKALLGKREYTAELPGLVKLSGTVKTDGEDPSLGYKGYFIQAGDQAHAITDGTMGEKARKCVEKLAGSNAQITLYGKLRDEGLARQRVEVTDLDPSSSSVCN